MVKSTLPKPLHCLAIDLRGADGLCPKVIEQTPHYPGSGHTETPCKCIVDGKVTPAQCTASQVLVALTFGGAGASSARDARSKHNVDEHQPHNQSSPQHLQVFGDTNIASYSCSLLEDIIRVYVNICLLLYHPINRSRALIAKPRQIYSKHGGRDKEEGEAKLYGSVHRRQDNHSRTCMERLPVIVLQVRKLMLPGHTTNRYEEPLPHL